MAAQEGLPQPDGGMLSGTSAPPAATRRSGDASAAPVGNDAADALRDAEDRFRCLVEEASDLIAEVDERGVFTYASPGYRRALGLDPAALIGTAAEEMVHPEDREAVVRHLPRRSGFGIRLRARHADGAYRWFDASFRTFLNRSGAPRVVVTSRDVTNQLEAERALRQAHQEMEAHVLERTAELRQEIADRRKAEGALRASQRRFSDLYHSITDALVETRLDGALTEFNAAFVSLTGYPAERLRGMHYNDLTPEEYHETERAVVECIVRGGSHGAYQKEYRRRDGSRVPVELQVYRLVDGDGEPTGSWAIVRDITERRKAEAALRQSRELFYHIFTASPLGLGLAHLDGGRFMDVNQALLDIMQRSRDDVIGRSPADMDLWAVAEQRRALMQPLLSGDDSSVVDARWTLPDGHEVHVQVNARRVALDESNLILIGVTDITVKAREAEALRLAAEAASAASKAKSVFLANMSHEIRTPMNAIMGFAQLVAQDEELPDRCRQQLEVILRSGEHLLGLINAVLEMSRIEAGRMAVASREFGLRTLLKDVAAMFHLRALAKGLQFVSIGSESAPPHVAGDDGKVRQVLVNLLGNAVKFTKRGHVTLRSCWEADHDNMGWLVVSVEDTGPGISGADQARLFRPFEQASGVRATQAGTGLGLAISRDIARLMGGDITVISAPGQGSVFELRVPLAVAEAPDRSDSPKTRIIGLAPGQEPPTVLMVDDSEDNRRLVCDALRPLGMWVHEARDGAEGVDLWLHLRPTITLMDMRMPGMDGCEAIRRIRAAEAEAGVRTPILALTAAMFEEDRSRLMAAGADDVLVKPIDIDRLLVGIGAAAHVAFTRADEPQPEHEPPAAAPPEELSLPAVAAAALRSDALNGNFSAVHSRLDELEAAGHAIGALRGLADQYDGEALARLLNNLETSAGR
ncbi:MAG: PAS domain S-box protein [Armatimonadetes bacterium]|nr:PAS domain S-box protein [Armatimonadota bacterium]